MTDPYKQADRARWLRDLLCGALIGAGAILPGVSGGVLAGLIVGRSLHE